MRQDFCCAMTATEKKSALYVPIQNHQWPIVYSPEYNITLCGLEKLQAYDTCKGGNAFLFLKEAGLLTGDNIVRPVEAQAEHLTLVHSRSYLENLKLSQFIEGLNQWGSGWSGLSELPPVVLLPNFLIDSKVLRPLRYQTGGTVLALWLAVKRGWAVNLGGGFHHCSSNRGGGFCAYADVTLAIRTLFTEVPDVNRVMVIDLDASQGNGLERDFMNDENVYILDMYNRKIYPQDGFAKRGINCKVELQPGTTDEEYLHFLRIHLDDALNEFTPDVVLYIAGCSVLYTDVTGGLSLTAQGIIERDQIVVQKVRTRGIPIAMVTGGGYTRLAASVIAQSLLHLHRVGLITGPDSALFISPKMMARCDSWGTFQSHSDSVWSRLRSMSVTNFMSSSKAVPLVPNKDFNADSCHEVSTDDIKLAIATDDESDQKEIGRCISMPNIQTVRCNKEMNKLSPTNEGLIPLLSHDVLSTAVNDLNHELSHDILD